MILCWSEAEARRALEQVRQWTAQAGLARRPEKTRRKITRAKRLGRQAPLAEVERQALGDDSEEAMLRALELARLSEALEQLGKLDARAAEVVILKTGGLTNQEIADNLTITIKL